jgi:hypothetical protein
MGAYRHFHYPNHQAQLRRWGFDLNDWLAEYRTCLRSLDVTPAERVGWFRLFQELSCSSMSRRRLGRLRRSRTAGRLAGTSSSRTRVRTKREPNSYANGRRKAVIACFSMHPLAAG